MDEEDDDADEAPIIIKTNVSRGASEADGQPVAETKTEPTAEAKTAPLAEPITDPDVPEHYEILEVCSECQHGKSFLVYDKTLDTKFTLRFVTIGVARLTGGLPIETVAQLLMQQTHPHLATVYDWRTDMKTNCMILDAPTERSVETIIRTEGFLDLPRAIDIMIQVCEGLEELHRVNVVHGYIRPRSLGIVESSTGIDTAKVTNFSITNILTNNIEQPLKIARNYTCNDVFYMSPEELRGETPTIAADIYSLGCVIFHAITGKPVYRARTVQEVKALHLDPTPAAFRRRYEIPPHVEAVVLHMIETDPLKRYKDARSIRRDLERIRDRKEPILEDKWKRFISYFGQ
ncbi:MAG: serine/threonine-protein kinase [Candidatus Melainabacteria bacterium]|nr:serine/threonine-protein kinase [Candidatus Melainabacteria bacterium]